MPRGIHMKGRKLSMETRKKISLSLKGKPAHNKGVKLSEETKMKISQNNSRYWKGKHFKREVIEKMIKTKTGIPSPKKGIPIYSQRGKNHWNWQGGKTEESKIIRNSLEYKEWRIRVFIRDNFSCVKCGSKNNIQADHIKPFSLFPELRFVIDNGRTLCKDCHKLTLTFGHKLNLLLKGGEYNECFVNRG